MELDPYVEGIHAQLDAAARGGRRRVSSSSPRASPPPRRGDPPRPAGRAVSRRRGDHRRAGARLGRAAAPRARAAVRRDHASARTPQTRSARRPDDAPPPSVEGDDAISRINLRMPEHLKARVELAADAESLSVNAWLVRAAAARLERREGPPRRASTRRARRPALPGMGAIDHGQRRATKDRDEDLRNPRPHHRRRGAQRGRRPDRRRATAPTRSSRSARATRGIRRDVAAAAQTRVEYANGHLPDQGPKAAGDSGSRGAASRRRAGRPPHRVAGARRRGRGDAPQHRPPRGVRGSRSASATSTSTRSAPWSSRPAPVTSPSTAPPARPSWSPAPAAVRIGLDRRSRRREELERRHLDRRGDGRGARQRRQRHRSRSVGRAPASWRRRPGQTSIERRRARRRRRPERVRRLEVGVREGSAVWLDLDTKFGQRARTSWTPRPSPGPNDDVVEVHAHTSYGDISVRRVLATTDGRDGRHDRHRTCRSLEVSGLRKSFGDTMALDGVDLRVSAGTVFALLGPNGAGKTTAVHILSTLIEADSGEVRVAGHDPAREAEAVRRRDRSDRPILGGGHAPDRRGEPGSDGRPLPPGTDGGETTDRRAARPVRPGRVGSQACDHATRAACVADSISR